MAAIGSATLPTYPAATFSPSLRIPRPRRTAQDTLPSPRPSKQPRLARPNPDDDADDADDADDDDDNDDESPVRPIRLPEPLSISDILRSHSRERLLVNPLQWTAQQLQLLEFQFRRRRKAPRSPRPMDRDGHCAQSDDEMGREPQRQPRQDEQRDGRWDGHQRPQPRSSHAEAIYDAVRYLRRRTIPEFRAATITHLLTDYGLHRVGNCLDLSFDRRRIAGVQTNGVFGHADSGSPTLVYLDLETHATRREDYMIPPVVYRGRSSGSRPPNFPVIRLGKKKLCRVRPTIEVEDPYIAAALIALAQKQRDHYRGEGIKTLEQADTPPSSLEPATEDPREPTTCYKVHLIAIPNGVRELCFYNASIPSAFLNKLDQPSLYFPSKPVLISYYCIPLQRTLRTTSAIHDMMSAVRGESELLLG